MICVVILRQSASEDRRLSVAASLQYLHRLAQLLPRNPADAVV
jgi:hypothetical protein